MSWARLDDTAHSHPKFVDAGLEAIGLWTIMLSHCAAYLTDGRVRRADALLRAGSVDKLEELAGRLVTAGLWETRPDGGWQFHDFLHYNFSRVQAQEQRADLSAKRAEAGRKGAAARWQSDGKASACHDGKPLTNGAPHGGSAPFTDGKLPSALPSRLPSTRNSPGPIPTRSHPDQGEERAPSAPLTLSGELSAANGKTSKVRKAPKHTPEQVAAKQKLVDHFDAVVFAKKDVHPTPSAADHAAAFTLVASYGEAEACAMVTRALEQPFVLNSNCTLRYIASKPDTFRGTEVRRSGRPPLQQVVGDEPWLREHAKS